LDEGPNNIAVHLFSFPSLAEYERYRTAVRDDEEGGVAPGRGDPVHRELRAQLPAPGVRR